MADQLTDGRRFRALTIVGVFTRENLAIEVSQALRGTDVAAVLNQIRLQRGAPKMCPVIMGRSSAARSWTCGPINGVKIDFSGPGKPTDNAYIETFHGTRRAECLDTHWFETQADAKEIIETWRREYNASRPRRAPGEKTPNEFAKKIAARRDLLGLQATRIT